jgi:hypothetical protein
MLSPETHRPAFGALLTGQLRAVALALVREATLAGIALALICILSLLMALRYNERLDLDPGLLQPTLIVAMLLPFAVWKGDPAFGHAYLWTLPVRRQEAAIAKTLAGAVWLMAAMLVTFLSLSAVVLASGGSVGVSAVRLVDMGGGLATATRMNWSTPVWMWLTPFGSALVLYLLVSAALLGLRYPFRWLAGIGAGVPLVLILMASIAPEGVIDRAVETFRETLWGGAFGIDFVMNGGETSLGDFVSRDDRRILWRSLPDPGRWAMATFVWLSAAALAVALALRRHWER